MDKIYSYLTSNLERAAYFAQTWEELLAEYPQLFSLRRQEQWDQFRKEHPGLNLDANLWMYGPASLDDHIQELIQKFTEEELVSEDQKPDQKEKQKSAGMHPISGYIMQRNKEGGLDPLINASLTVTDISTKKKLQTLITDSRGYFKTNALLPYKKYLLVLRHKSLGAKDKKRVVNMKAFQPPLRMVLTSQPQGETQDTSTQPPQERFNMTVDEWKNQIAPETNPLPGQTQQSTQNKTALTTGVAIPFTERAGFSSEINATASTQPISQSSRFSLTPAQWQQKMRGNTPTPPQQPLTTSSPDDLPDNETIQSFEREITRMTNLSEALRGVQAPNDPVWIREHAKISRHQWDLFLRSHPELARQFATYAPIAAALERQKKQGIDTDTPPVIPVTKDPYAPFTQEKWFQNLSDEIDQEEQESERLTQEAIQEEEAMEQNEEQQETAQQQQKENIRENQNQAQQAQQNQLRKQSQQPQNRAPEVRRRIPSRGARNPLLSRLPGAGGRGGIGNIGGRFGGMAAKGVGKAGARVAILLLNPTSPGFWILVALGLIILLLIIFFGFQEPEMGEASVTLTKTGPAEVDNEQEINYQLKVSYTNANQVTVKDVLPQNTDFVSAGGPGNPTYNETTRTVTWTLTGLGGGSASGSGSTSGEGCMKVSDPPGNDWAKVNSRNQIILDKVKEIEQSDGVCVPVNLIKSLIYTESGGEMLGINGAGYGGIMQVGTGSNCDHSKYDIYNIEGNVGCGVQHLARGYKTCNAWEGTVTAYYAGHCTPNGAADDPAQGGSGMTDHEYTKRIIDRWHEIDDL